jgi:hypothetical protein
VIHEGKTTMKCDCAQDSVNVFVIFVEECGKWRGNVEWMGGIFLNFGGGFSEILIECWVEILG